MLTHKGTQTIQTERLILRRFTADDAQAMFGNWANDERVTRFLTWTPHGSPEFTKRLLTAWAAAYEKPNIYNWAMALDGRLIGNISAVGVSDRSEWAELGYCMGQKWWNKGLMTEAARAASISGNNLSMDLEQKPPEQPYSQT